MPGKNDGAKFPFSEKMIFVPCYSYQRVLYSKTKANIQLLARLHDATARSMHECAGD